LAAAWATVALDGARVLVPAAGAGACVDEDLAAAGCTAGFAGGLAAACLFLFLAAAAASAGVGASPDASRSNSVNSAGAEARL
jgi:hypothetical protein